jgi:hypothetical protein
VIQPRRHRRASVVLGQTTLHHEKHLVHHVLRHRVGDAVAADGSPHERGVPLVDVRERGRVVDVVGAGMSAICGGRIDPHRPF